jgi:hypothetical protein
MPFNSVVRMGFEKIIQKIHKRCSFNHASNSNLIEQFNNLCILILIDLSNWPHLGNFNYGSEICLSQLFDNLQVLSHLFLWNFRCSF